MYPLYNFIIYGQSLNSLVEVSLGRAKSNLLCHNTVKYYANIR